MDLLIVNTSAEGASLVFIITILGIPLIVAFTGSTFVCGISWQYFGL